MEKWTPEEEAEMQKMLIWMLAKKSPGMDKKVKKLAVYLRKNFKQGTFFDHFAMIYYLSVCINTVEKKFWETFNETDGNKQMEYNFKGAISAIRNSYLK